MIPGFEALVSRTASLFAVRLSGRACLQVRGQTGPSCRVIALGRLWQLNGMFDFNVRLPALPMLDI